ncbi:MAG TPA: 16S rRNA (cytosine(967)-C(5))-methyltransferase RsmB [Clostridiaceae bacterium]|nr:16S rRNA (cytosine(967)-C(5))-methyltransferase RsmB [Clostridiaceae bacterium]
MSKLTNKNDVKGIDAARETALKILYDINEKGAYSNISINRHFAASKLKEIDKAFATELVYGTIRWKLTIDWVIEKFSSVKLSRISPWIMNILRMGVYQTLFVDRVPETAACNESVKLAKKYGHTASSGYVNAILRNIARNKDKIEYPDKNRDVLRFLSIKHSHPEWMVKKWVDLFGIDFTEELLESNNEAPEITVRVNTLKTTRDELAENLKASGYEVENGRYVEQALIIKNPHSLIDMETFKKGYFQVQDESSMLVSRILDPKPGELVMDVCSAPGGKATHIAELMKNEGCVIARDIHEHKIKLINDAANRLGLDIVKTELFDAAIPDERYREKADKVLVDAPCTGLGIIRRKPDIKWERTEADITGIVRLQKKILRAASTYVKPGGALVYSTCTINPEENEEVIKDFVSSDSSFSLADVARYLPQSLRKADAVKGYIQLFPNVDKVDGFFIAKFIKKE